MKILIQRVTSAQVVVDNEIKGSIDSGMMVLLGITHDDTIEDVQYLVKKLLKLRIFNDDQGVMNWDINKVGGGILLISQFTLYGDVKKGNRPSYIKAAKPEQANMMYELFIKELKGSGITVETGEFGAQMEVTLTNSGPVTILIDSDRNN